MVGLPLLILFTSVQVTGDDQQLLQAIKTAYQANRERLNQGHCKYALIQGNQRSITEARQGAIEDSTKAKCYYAYAAKVARLDRVYPLELLAANTKVVGERRVLSRALNLRCLTDGANTLCDNGSLDVDIKSSQVSQPLHESHHVQIERGWKSFFRELDFPLRIGHPDGDFYDVANAIEQAAQVKSGAGLVSIELDAVYEAFEVVKLTLKRDNTLITYFIDINHGGIPRKIHSVNTKTKMESTLLYDDVQDVGRSTYFPFRETLYFSDGLFKHIAVEEFHLGTPPTSTFELHFQEPTRALDKVHSINLAARKIFRLADLRGVVGPRDRRSAVQLVSQAGAIPKMPGELEPGFSNGVMILIVLAVVGGIASTYFLLSWKKAA